MLEHCEIGSGAKFRVKEKHIKENRLGVLKIIKEGEELKWYVTWDDNEETGRYPLPWIECVELYETDTEGYCLCHKCVKGKIKKN